MASSNASWGIEIGAGAIKALKVELDGENWVVADYAVINHPKVLSTPDLDQEDALRVSLGTLVSQKDLSGASIAISVPGHQSFARFAKLPPVEPKKVPDIVKFEAVQQIPFPLDDVEWDYQTFVSPESPEIEVGIFAITRPRIMEKLQLLGDLGVTPDVATLSPISAYNALAADLEFTEDTPGTIIVDIGTQATDIIIADAGRVWVRTFPIGGHQFTDALVTSFKLSYSKAERLKREAEQTKHARHVFQALRPVFTDLVGEIQRSIGFYQSVHEGADLKRVIGLGSTFQIPGLKRYLKQQLGMDTYRIEQFKKLTVDPAIEEDFNGFASNMATAYGLAIQGLGMGTLNANLMPVKVVREAMWKRKRAWFGVAAGLAAAAGAAMFVRPVLDHTSATAADRPAAIDRAIREAGNLKREADDLGVTGADSGDTTADRIVALLEGRDLFAHVNADLSEVFAEATETARADGLIAADDAAFELVSGVAYYAPPEAAQQANPRGGGWQDPSQPAAQAAETPSQFTRVQANLAVRVPMVESDAVEFADAFVRSWVSQNASREGLPYRVMIDEQPVFSSSGGGQMRGGQAGGALPTNLFAPGVASVTRQQAQQRRAAPQRSGPRNQSRGNVSLTIGGPGGQMPGGAFNPGAGGGARAVLSDDQAVRRMQEIAPIVRPDGGAGGTAAGRAIDPRTGRPVASGGDPASGPASEIVIQISFVLDDSAGGES